MFYFTTYFDINYLPRGLVLYDSLKKHCPTEFKLFILCLDLATLKYFKKNESQNVEVIPLSLNEIEKSDNDLLKCKQNRSKIEYYFTLSPCLPLYILTNYKIPHICSLDADIMFFGSPKPLFDKLDFYSIIITPHNFTQELKSREELGIYNVSFQIFKNDSQGLECLESWRKECIAWCYDKLENNKYADQKYLDNWPNIYKYIFTNKIPGAGIAPWNINKFKIKYKNKNLYLNNEKLIFYHYHGLRIINKYLILHNLNNYNVTPNKLIKDKIYKPYIKFLIAYNNYGDSKIFRLKFDTQNNLFIYLFIENNWFIYFKGNLLNKNKSLIFLSKLIIFTNNLLKKWLK